MATELCRDAVKEHLDDAVNANAGLLLRRGMTCYDDGKVDGDKNKGGTAKQRLIGRIAGIGPSKGYRLAFARWQRATADATRFSSFSVPLVGRLYIGVDRDNALETGITVQHVWGMPMIPGSALKGLARAAARERLAGKPDLVDWLFGDDTRDESALEAGAVIFHDAWWVPAGNAKPFVAEVVTPHHGEYYKGTGAPATDFDSPIPAAQIAAQGEFHFTLEGEQTWRGVAEALLRFGLAELGIGGKRSSGYGYFECP